MQAFTNDTFSAEAHDGLDASDREAAEGLSRIGHLRWTPGQPTLEACAEARRILHRGPDEAFGFDQLSAQVRRSLLPDLMARCRAAHLLMARRFTLDVPLVFADGSKHHVRAAVVNDYNEHGQLARSTVALQDITDLTRLARELADTQLRLNEAQEISHLGDWEWDFVHNTSRYSPEAARIFGLKNGESPGFYALRDLVPMDQKDSLKALFQTTIAKQEPMLRYDFWSMGTGERREYHGRVRFTYNAAGMPLRLRGTIQDITELRETHRQLHSVSYYDPVTALPNRTMLMERMRELMQRSRGEANASFGLLALGLDRIKHVQESLGHSAGDALLRQAAQRLGTTLRQSDLVARLGGEHFAVLLPDVRHPDEVARVADKLVQAFGQTFTLDGSEVLVSLRVGAALFPTDAGQAEELLQHANTALSNTHQPNQEPVLFYTPQFTEQASERLRLEGELRRALSRNELLLHYQPKFELGSQRLVGAEALMRWKHPQRGLVSPLSFIPLAEETGLIVQMGEWALHEACRTVVGWNVGRAQPLKVAVNLSARQFSGGGLVHTVTQALAEHNCPPECLELEITESLLLDGRDETRVSLETLSKLGITIALDDFGTGYSALSYLTRLPVQTLKIDRSFVKGLPHDRNSVELAKAIVSLGKGLDMVLVAEGIETPEQAAFLGGLGCQLAQGFLFGRPLEAEAFAKLL